MFRVSSNEIYAGLTQAIMYVLVLPPRESFRRRVSLESLYGTNAPFLDMSDRIFMQLPKARRDLLMFAPSTRRIPLFSVTAARSDPAKSTKQSLLEVYTVIFPLLGFYSSGFLFVYSKVNVKIACDRELKSFCLVGAIYLLVFPSRISSVTSVSNCTSFSINPGTNTPRYVSSTTMRFSETSLDKRSLIDSL